MTDVFFFFFGCPGSSLLWAFSGCGEHGLVFIAICRLLVAVVSLAVGCAGSIPVAHYVA